MDTVHHRFGLMTDSTPIRPPGAVDLHSSVRYSGIFGPCPQQTLNDLEFDHHPRSSVKWAQTVNLIGGEARNLPI